MDFSQRNMNRKPANARSAPVTLKERLDALKNLPRFFKLIWQTSPWMTIANCFLRMIRSTLPLAMLYVGKLIIDQVIYLIQHKDSHEYLWKLIAAEFALAILSDVLSRAVTLLDSLLGDLFANHTSVKLMEHAATLDLDQFE